MNFTTKVLKAKLTDKFERADPESFFRDGPTLTTFYFFYFFFILMRVEGIQLLVGHQRPASETPFKWRFAGGPMMAQH